MNSKRIRIGIAICTLIVMLIGIIPAQADATARRNAFEFAELCAKRIERYNATAPEKEKIKDTIYGLSTPPMYSETDITVSSEYATITIGKEDFSVKVAFTNLMNIADQDSATSDFAKAGIVFSALEYQDMDDGIIATGYKLGLEEYSSAAEKSMALISDQINNLPDEVYAKAINDGEDVLFYSGNYDWYIGYTAYSYGGKDYQYLMLTAEARE